MSSRWASVGLVLALLLGGAACGDDAEAPFAGYERSPTPYVGDLSLRDTDGRELAFRAPDGGLQLVYFGYTSCPDICPTTLADLGVALDSLEGDAAAAPVEVVMVSIDPEVDDPVTVSSYVQSFIPDARAVSEPDEAELRPVASAFGADYGKDAEMEAAGEDGVFHTTSLYAVNADGELILIWSFGTSSTQLTSDLQRLLDAAA